MSDARLTSGFSSHGLHFRAWCLDDAPVMAGLFDTEQMNRWTPLASPFTLEVARDYVAHALGAARSAGVLQFAVLQVPDGPPVGEVLVFPSAAPGEVELAYAIGVQHQRQGIATRAVMAALDVAREAGAHRALLSIAEGNEPSAAVALATGFTMTDDPLRERRRKGFVLQLRTWTRDL